jgi:hypothetical protein
MSINEVVEDLVALPKQTFVLLQKQHQRKTNKKKNLTQNLRKLQEKIILNLYST